MGQRGVSREPRAGRRCTGCKRRAGARATQRGGPSHRLRRGDTHPHAHKPREHALLRPGPPSPSPSSPHTHDPHTRASHRTITTPDFIGVQVEAVEEGGHVVALQRRPHVVQADGEHAGQALLVLGGHPRRVVAARGAGCMGRAGRGRQVGAGMLRRGGGYSGVGLCGLRPHHRPHLSVPRDLKAWACC